MRAIAIIVIAGASSGCAQILGLEKTHESQGADAPGVCDMALTCATDGSELCGRLFGIAAIATQVATPTGEVCSGTTEGPCGLTVMVQTKTDLFAGSAAVTPAVVDDCGRFKVSGLPTAMVDDMAVVVSGANVATTATLALERVMTAAQPVRAAVMLNETSAAWFATIGTAAVPAYLTQYPITIKDRSNWTVLLDDATPAQQTTAPFAYYFGGPSPFETIDPALAKTGPSGTSLVVPGTSAAFKLAGSAVGTSCAEVTGLKTVVGILVFFDQTQCRQ
jgi:hypothetical protein